MPVSRTIIDTITNEKYTIDLTQPVLGEGATAKVRRGRSLTGAAEVAVKIARYGMSEVQLRQFWDELELAKSLQVTNAAAHIPWMHKGNDPDDPQASIIVMEFIPSTWRLSSQIRADETRREILALAAGTQYASLLTALHDKGYSTKGDRKGGDLHWDAGQDRLVVLDWNRAGPIVDEAEKYEDIRSFGRLWTEFLIELQDTPEPDAPLPAWQAYSRGLRLILHRAFNSRAAWGYKDAAALTDDLELHQSRYRLLADPKALLARAEEEYNRGEAGNLHETLRSANRVLTLLDLIQRAKAGVQLDQTQIETLTTWATDQLSGASREIDQAVDNITRQLKRGYFPEAQELAQQALKENSFNGTYHPSRAAELLRLRRRLLVAEVGARGTKLSRVMGSTIEHLLTIVELLDPMLEIDPVSEQEIEQNLAFVETETPSELSHWWLLLRREFEIRRAIHQADKATYPERAEQLYEQARTAWDQLRTAENQYDYADRLRTALAPLDRVLTGGQIEASYADAMAQKQADFDQAWSQLQTRLGAETAGTWTDLAAEIQAVRNSYLDVRSPVTGQRGLPERQETYQFVSHLEDVNRRMVQGQIVEALEITRAIPDNHAEKWSLLARCQTVAYHMVEQIIEEGRWPDELEQGDRVLDALQDLPSLPPGKSQGDLLNLKEKLTEWRVELNEFRQRLGHLADSPARILAKPEDEEIDQILTEASEQRIEIYDRAGLGSDQTTQRSVAYLQAARQSARMVSNVENLANKLPDLGENLKQQSNTLRDILNGVDEVRTSYEQIRADLQANGLQQVIDEWGEKLEQYQQVVEQLEKVSSDLSEKETMVQQLSSKTGSLDTSIKNVESLIKNADQVVLSAQKEVDLINEKTNLLHEANHSLDLLFKTNNSREVQIMAIETISEVKHTLPLIFFTAGLQALRKFDLDAAKNFSEWANWLWSEYQKNSKGGDQNALQAVSNLFLTSLTPLNTLREKNNDVPKFLRDWREQIIKQDLSAARKAEAKLRQLLSEDDIASLFSHWMVSDLWSAYQAMQTNHLERVAVPDLSEVQDAQQSAVEDLSVRWEKAADNIPNGFTVPETLDPIFPATERLLNTTPLKPDASYWQDLDDQLDRAYEFIANQRNVAERNWTNCLVRVGILRFRLEALLSESPIDGSRTQEKLSEIQERIGSSLLFYNSNTFEDLTTAFRALATATEINSAELTERIMAHYYFAFLDYIRKHNDPLESLDEYGRLLGVLKQTHCLNGEEQEKLSELTDGYRMRQQFRNVITAWEKVEQRLNSPSDSLNLPDLQQASNETEELFNIANSNLSTRYWSELNSTLEPIYRGLKQIGRQEQYQGQGREKEIFWFLALYLRAKGKATKAHPEF